MDLFTRIYDHIVTETFSQHFQDVMNRKPIKYEAGREIQLSNPDVASQEGYINRLIVYVCVVINKGLIDIELVDDLIAMPIIQYWDRVEPWYREWRKESQDPTLGDDIEAAYHRLKQRREHQVTVAKQRLSAANA